MKKILSLLFIATLYLHDTTAQVKIIENGNVGIGTSDPLEKFHVSLDNNGDTILALFHNINPGANKVSLELRNSGQSSWLSSDRTAQNAGADIVFETKDFNNIRSEMMRITEKGNVGIGTLAPLNQLHVRKDYSGNLDIVKFQNGDPGLNKISVELINSGVSSWLSSERTGQNNGADIVFETENNVGIRSEYLRINELGNVGIGIINPSEKLDIIGSLKIQGRIIPSYGVGIHNIVIGKGAGNENNTGTYNTFIGYQSGLTNSTGQHNNFIGFRSGYSNTEANNNNFFGRESGYTNSIGANNNFLGYRAGFTNSTGAHNNFLGYQSGFSNTSGIHNNFFGYLAGNKNTEGAHNNFFGLESGYSNTSGYYNNYFGNQAGYNTTSGARNNFFGNQAGYKTTTASDNNFFGYQSGYSNTTGGYNNFFGYLAGKKNMTGTNNNFLGNQAGYTNSTGKYNNFLGHRAGYSNTTANYNNFLGREAGYTNTEGYGNNFYGYRAGYLNTTGIYNNFFGYQSGYSNTTGGHNNFFGYLAGNKNMTGTNNNFLGNKAGFTNTTGKFNNFLGHHAGYSNTTATYNNFLGFQSGYSNTEGYGNNFFGYRAGYNNVSGVKSVFIGFQAGYHELLSNRLHIANNSGTSLIYGEFDNNLLRVNGKLQLRDVATVTQNWLLSYNTSTDEVTKVAASQFQFINTDEQVLQVFEDTRKLKIFGGNTVDLSELIQEEIGTMVSGNTESGISVTYDDGSNELDFTVPVVDNQTLSQNSTNGTLTISGSGDTEDLTELIQDQVGLMVSGNTEDGVNVTYNDGANGLDFEVNNKVAFKILSSDYTPTVSDYMFIVNAPSEIDIYMPTGSNFIGKMYEVSFGNYYNTSARAHIHLPSNVVIFDSTICQSVKLMYDGTNYQLIHFGKR